MIPTLAAAAARLAASLKAALASLCKRTCACTNERELKRYRDIVDIAGDWCWETDAQRRFTFLPDRMAASVGLPSAQLIGRSIWGSNEYGVVAEQTDEIDKSIAAREPFINRVYRIRYPTGEVHSWRVSGKPYFEPETGAFSGYRGVATDITEDIAREQALSAALARAEAAEEMAREARASLLEAIEAVPVGFVQWDAEDRLVLCNSRFRDLYDRDGDAVVPGACFADLAHARIHGRQTHLDEEERARIIAERIERHQNCTPFEWRLANGHWIQVDERRIRNGGIVGVNVDVTDAHRRAATEQEREKLSALGHLAGGVAHEINNLLQPVITFPDLIAERLPPGDTESREDLATMLDSARKAREIVRNILLFARKEEPTLAPLDLATEVHASLDFLRKLLPPKVSVVESKAGDAKGALAAANKNQLAQVLTNLVVNAAHAMQDQGTVAVGVSRIEPPRSEAAKLGLEPGRPYLAVAVADTGCGMDAATRARVFEPFFTTKPVGSGTGLGLSVAYSILQSWHGSIGVKSEPGHGAVFTLYVPELDPAQIKSAAAAD